MHRPLARAGRLRVGAALAVLAVLAASCGSSKPKITSPTTAPGGGGATTTTAAPMPKQGGDLTMGVEAEIDGFDPTQNRFDITGHLYATTIYDPLTQIGKDGKAHPYLAQSITPNSDYTQWIITVRPNITFWNGDPLTGEIVYKDLLAQTKSILTGSALSDVKDVKPGPGPLQATVDTKEPWTVFPLYMAGQLGYMFDPASTDTVRKPIGTGPFMFKEWVPNDHFTAVRNPNYWQKGLPYLNSITFKPILDQTSRENSLLSGVVDIIHTDNPPTIIDLRKKSGITVLDTSQNQARTEMDFYMINTTAAPFNDPSLRKALAEATDEKSLINEFGAGILHTSNGPYTHGTPWYIPDTGYPAYNPTDAKALVDAWKAKNGGKAPSFTLDVTNTALSQETAQFVQDMWGQVGFSLKIQQISQSQYILTAVQGHYQVIGWRQFGEVDPDADYVWWDSAGAANPNFALNFARNTDPQIDADLTKGRTSTDSATRIAAYQDIAKQFGKDIPYIWTDESLWALAFNKKVQGVLEWTMPDGSPGADNLTVGGLGGGTIFEHVWLNS